jgi:hypothetical protein
MQKMRMKPMGLGDGTVLGGTDAYNAILGISTPSSATPDTDAFGVPLDIPFLSAINPLTEQISVGSVGVYAGTTSGIPNSAISAALGAYLPLVYVAGGLLLLLVFAK